MMNKNISAHATMLKLASSKKKAINNSTQLPAILPHLLFPKVMYKPMAFEPEKLAATEKLAST